MSFAKSVTILVALSAIIVAQPPPPSEYTLDSCPDSVGVNVPPFFSKYFACLTIVKSGQYIVFTGNGLPPHESWYWSETHPNFIEWVSQGAGYFLNPNTISPQDIGMSVPINPTPRGLAITESLVDGSVGTSTYEYPMSTAGLALNGISLFNPLAAPGDDIWDEIYSFDYYNGHPDAEGTYHNHTVGMGPLEVLEHRGLITTTTPGSGEIEMYGMMCDGTVVLGCTELDGSSVDTTGFDAQSGHVHDLVDEDGVTHFSNRYHTHMCWAWETSQRLTPEIQYYEDCLMEALTVREDAPVPDRLALRQNFPNPFNPSTVIRYDLPAEGAVTLKVYSLLGRELRSLASGAGAAGYHQVSWDGRDDAGRLMPAGVYLYRLATEQGTVTKKLVLLK